MAHEDNQASAGNFMAPNGGYDFAAVIGGGQQQADPLQVGVRQVDPLHVGVQ